MLSICKLLQITHELKKKKKKKKTKKKKKKKNKQKKKKKKKTNKKTTTKLRVFFSLWVIRWSLHIDKYTRRKFIHIIL